MNDSVRWVILGLRCAAVAAMILSVTLLWEVMALLPWQIDCAIAASVALAFAYRFERL